MAPQSLQAELTASTLLESVRCQTTQSTRGAATKWECVSEPTLTVTKAVTFFTTCCVKTSHLMYTITSSAETRLAGGGLLASMRSWDIAKRRAALKA